MEYIISLIVLAFIVLNFIAKIKQPNLELSDSDEALYRKALAKSKNNHEFKYQRIEQIVTPAEFAFYKALIEANDNTYTVFSKVRIADVLRPKPGLKGVEWKIAFNKIARKHFDFVLCCPDTMAIRMAIELDDSSHNKPERVERDKFVNAACESASFKLVRFKVRQKYDITAIQRQLGIKKEETPPPKPIADPLAPIKQAAVAEDPNAMQNEF